MPKLTNQQRFKLATTLAGMNSHLDGKTYNDVAGTMSKILGYEVDAQNIKTAAKLSGVTWNMPEGHPNPLARMTHQFAHLQHQVADQERAIRLICESLGMNCPLDVRPNKVGV